MIERPIIIHCDGRTAHADGNLFCLTSIKLPEKSDVIPELNRREWKALPGDKHLCPSCAKAVK